MGSLVKGIFGGDDSAKKASKIQKQAADAQIEEIRRQYDETVERMQPFVDAGLGFEADVTGGSGQAGLASRLESILGQKTFRGLIDERMRAVGDQFARVGLSRSGAGMQAAANVPTDLALQLEGLLFNRQSNLFQNAQNASANLGVLGANAVTGIGDERMAGANARAAGILQAQQANAAMANNILGMGAGAALGSGALGGAGLFGGGLSGALGGALMFSDETLKENIEPIGKVKDLTLYEWDWKPGVPEHLGEMTIGFLAQEVEDAYPHHVAEVGGIKVINYPGLLAELESEAA